MKELPYRIEDINPVLRTRLDSPYEISNELYSTLRHVLHDVGGQPDAPQPYLEKEEEEWEMNTYVTCECLGLARRLELGGAPPARERPRRDPLLRAPLLRPLGDGRGEDADRQGHDHARRALGEARRGAGAAGGRAMSRRFEIGDRVTVKDATTPVPHPDAAVHPRSHRHRRRVPARLGDPRGRGVGPRRGRAGSEPFYVVRFRQKDLWADYTGFEADTLETEVSERWLEPAQ